jgi:hypothetical protein
MSLNVVDFPNQSLADVPAKLRDLADLVAEKHFGETETVVVVLKTDTHLEVFGLGAEADGTVAHYLLQCAARKIEDALLEAVV